MSTKVHTCLACGYETKYTTNMKNHLTKVKSCVDRHDDRYQEMRALYLFDDKSKKEKSSKIVCKICNKEFKWKQSLSQHKKICKGIPHDMENRIKLLEEKVSNTVIQGNIHIHNHNTQNLIIINQFGSEDYSHVIDDKPYLDQCVRRRDKGLAELIIEVLKKPENRNIRPCEKSENSYDVMIGESWETRHKSNIAVSLIDKYRTILCNHWNNNQERTRMIAELNMSDTRERDIDDFIYDVKNKDIRVYEAAKSRLYKFFETLKPLQTTHVATIG